MATLYTTASTTRKIIIGFLAVGVVFLGLDLIQRVPKTTPTNTNTNRCYLPADNIFGTIVAPKIPSISVTTQGASYLLEGVYTLFPDVAYVHSIEKPREKLLVFENAQKVIDSFGFTSAQFEELGEGNYQWSASNNTKTLKFNKTLQSWDISTKMEDNLDALRRKTLSRDLNYYIRQVQRIISTASFNNYGMENAIIDTRFAKLVDGIFTEKTTPEESDYVFGNAYRSLRAADLKSKTDLPDTALCKASKNIDVQAYGSDPRVGQLKVLVSENASNYATDLYSLNFINYEYSSKKGVYSIITPDEAWNRVQSGSGSLVSILPQNYNYFAEFPSNVTVRRFTADRARTVLGYYEPKEWSGYVYPIYVFQGRAELTDGRVASFTFFVNALR